MPSPEPYLVFVRKFNELGLRYMVSGSVAAIFYGEPRLTNDIDIVVYLTREDARCLPGAFPLEEFYCPPLEVIESERGREQRGHFNLIHLETGFKADIYLSSRDPLHAWGLRNVNPASIDGEAVVFAPPEYVVVRKLQFFAEGGSPKHLRDIHRMLVGLGDDWDRGVLLGMVAEHRLERPWQLALEHGD